MKGCISPVLKRSAARGVALFSAVFLGGCASYQYVLVEPADHRETIPKKGAMVAMSPLEYHFIPSREQLGLQLMNLSTQPVRLVGEKSYVVDPSGATHPLPGGTIAPNAHIGLFFPPTPVIYRSYPRFNLGFGFGGFYGGPAPYYPYYGAWAYDPGFYGPIDMYAINAPNQWDWQKGEVRTRLVFEGNGTNFEHNFTFNRQRGK